MTNRDRLVVLALIAFLFGIAIAIFVGDEALFF